MKPKLTKEAWKRIVEDAFAGDAPEPKFSSRYRARRLELERMVTMKENRNITFQPGLAAATAAALLIAAVPTGMIWHASRNKITPPEAEEITLAPAAAVQMPADETETIAQETTPDPGFMTVEYGWLPEGMYLHEDGPYGGKIHADADNTRGITPDLSRLPEGTDFDTFCQALQQGMAADPNDWTFGTQPDGDNCIWLDRHGNGWDQVWVAFHDAPYVMHLFVLGLTDEEVNSVMEGLRLVPAEEESAGTWVAPEEREPEELEFSMEKEISLSEANEMDAPWKGKVLQQTELAGMPLEEARTGAALKKSDSYPALCIWYRQTDKWVDVSYTAAPMEEMRYIDDPEVICKNLDYQTFRVQVLAWGCTDEEFSLAVDAVDKAAADVPAFWLRYGINNHGETYASAGQVHFDRTVYDQLPDLIEFDGSGGQAAYARKTELFEIFGDDPDTAMLDLMQDHNKTDTAVEFASLNLYDKEGETVLAVVKYYNEP